MKGKPRWSKVDFRSCAPRAERMGKLKWMEFVEESAREKRAAPRETLEAIQ